MRLQPADLEEAWPSIGHLVQEVAEMENSGRTVPGIIEEIGSGELEIWVVIRGGVVALFGLTITEIENGDRTLEVVFMVGKEMKHWIYLREQIEDYARFRECDAVQSMARKGWAKYMPDYKITNIILRKALT